jgi:hypothetical protein
MPSIRKQQMLALKLTGKRPGEETNVDSFSPDLRKNLPKKRPRGRPWPQGVSGNPAGRPKGALNKLTLAMLEGIQQAEAELAKPKVLDTSRPYEYRDGYLIQEGLLFDCDSHEALPPDGPAPEPPQRFDPGERRIEMMWHGRLIYVQHGWPFDPTTWRRLKV